MTEKLKIKDLEISFGEKETVVAVMPISFINKEKLSLVGRWSGKTLDVRSSV